MGFAEDLGLNLAPDVPAALPSGPSGSSFTDWLSSSTTGAGQPVPEAAKPEAPRMVEAESTASNPVEWVGGMLKHVVTGIPELIGGLWTLGSHAAVDAIGNFEKIIPGTKWQGAERYLEEHGSGLAEMGRSLVGWGDRPSIIKQDYASRYGVYGMDEMLDQMYENPLSYILDFIGAGSAVAKGGLVGGKAAGALGKAGVIAPETAARVQGLAGKIRGIPFGSEQLAQGVSFGAGVPTKPLTTLRGGNVVQGPPVQSFGSDITQLSQGVIGMGTSVNPAKRVIQNLVVDRLLSRSVPAAQELLEAAKSGDTAAAAKLGIEVPPGYAVTDLPPGQLRQAGERIGMASQEGFRIATPQAEKFIASRSARWIAGITKQNFYASRNPMIAELRKALEVDGEGAADTQLVKSIQGTNEYLEDTMAGVTLPLDGMPSSAPIAINHGDIPVIAPEQAAALPPGVDPNMWVNHFEQLTKTLNQTPEVTIERLDTPYSLTDDAAIDSRVERFNILVPNQQDAPGVINQLARQHGWQPAGVVDDLAVPGGRWNGHTYVMSTPEGTNVHLNVATPELFEAQKINSKINKYLGNNFGAFTAAEQETAHLLRTLGADDIGGIIPSSLSPEEQSLLGRLQELEQMLPKLKEEAEAAARVFEEVWRQPMRRLNNPDGYDPTLMKTDNVYNWSTKWGLLKMIDNWAPDWVERQGMRGPITTHMNRSFYPMKLNILHDFLRTGEKQIVSILENAKRAGGAISEEDVFLEIEDVLRNNFYFPKAAVHDALMSAPDEEYFRAVYAASKEGKSVSQLASRSRRENTMLRGREMSTWGDEATPTEEFRPMKNFLDDPEGSARKITDRLMQKLRLPILRGQDLEDMASEAWSWQNFADSLPQLPAYYPHNRIGSKTDLLLHNSRLAKPRTTFQKQFQGFLEETGRVQQNPFKAYSQRAYQLLRREELSDQLDVLKSMAREVGTKEASLIANGSYVKGGEVFFSPDLVKTQLKLDAELTDNITQFMDDGMLIEDAAMKSLRLINQNLQEGITKDLVESGVYALPKHVADQFKSGLLAGVGRGTLRVFWDSPRDLWIAATLSLNPRWLFYRTMGNAYFTGIRNPMALGRIFGWTSRKNDKVIEAMMAATLTSNGSLKDLLSRGYVQSATSRLGELPGGGNVKSWGSAASEYPRITKMASMVHDSRFGQRVAKVSQGMTRWVNHMEQAERRGIALGEIAKQTGQRFESSLTLAKKLAVEGLDEPSVNHLINEVNWTLGNYTTLSPMERDVVRRFVMPFYPFYRHMIKFSLRMPWDHPVKSQTLRLLREADEDIGPYLPEYIGAAIPLGELGGLPLYWNITYWNPLGDLAKPETTPLGFIDPRLKMFLQAWTGTDEFGRPFHSPNVYEAPNGMKMVRTESGWEPFHGKEHPSWWAMALSMYGGPGSQFINANDYNMPWQKSVAGSFGVSIFQDDPFTRWKMEQEAQLAAMQSPYAQQMEMMD